MVERPKITPTPASCLNPLLNYILKWDDAAGNTLMVHAGRHRDIPERMEQAIFRWFGRSKRWIAPPRMCGSR